VYFETKEITSGYYGKQVLNQVSLGVEQGEIVTLVGHNGAGKTTTLRTIFGLLPLTGGNIYFDGQDISHLGPAQKVRVGLVYVPQEKSLFPDLSVLENLKMAAYSLPRGASISNRLQRVNDLFPVLAERKSQKARLLSGGEQRMLALGMALIMQPKVLLLDEPSLGLAPLMVKRVMETVKEINEQLGVSILLVEQNLAEAVSIASRVYIMKTGQVIFSDSTKNIPGAQDLWHLF
jgi:branched-chain amino acid transport system ATP-binding protein